MKKRSIFTTWLITYLSILIIPISAAFVLTYQAQTIIQKEIEHASLSMLDQLTSTIDMQLADAQRLFQQVSVNKRLSGLIYVKNEFQDYHHYNKNTLVYDLMSYSTTNGSIDDFYVVLHHTNVVLTPYTVTEPQELFPRVHPGTSLTFDDWNTHLTTRRENHFAVLPSVNQSEQIVYVGYLPMALKDAPDAAFVAILNTDRLMSVLESAKLGSASCVYILDEQDNIVLATDGRTSSDMVFKNFSQTDRTLLHRSDRVIAYSTSSVENWKYVIDIPKHDYWGTLDSFRYFCIICIVLCVVISTFAIVYFTRRNYFPVNEMLNWIAKKTGFQREGKRNEYTQIMRALDGAMQQHERRETLLEKQSKTVKQFYLTRLLRGSISDEEEARHMIRQLGTRIEQAPRVVILINIVDCSSFITSKDQPSEMELVHYLITNVTEEILSERFGCEVVTMDSFLTVLVSLQGNGTAELLQKLDAIRAFILDKCLIRFSVAVSSPRNSLPELQSAYLEAMEVLEYLTINPSAELICYDEIRESRKSYEYPLDVECTLTNHILAGDMESAKQLFYKLYRAYVSHLDFSAQKTKCFLYEVAGTIIKSINLSDEAKLEAYLEKLDPYTSLNRCLRIADMEHEIVVMMEQVCALNSKSQEANRLSNEVKQYIDEHFAENSLNVSAIAAAFSLSTTYLSRVFKAEAGEGILDYLNKRRIEEAKNLLLHTEDPLTKIASQIGYWDSNSFIRQFKKHERMTPGQFRSAANK